MTGKRSVAALWATTMVMGGLFVGSANSQEDTSVAIGGVSVSGNTVTIDGSLVLGPSSKAQVQVATDPVGDDADGGLVPNGLDLTTASIELDNGSSPPYAQNQLVFSIRVSDMPPYLQAIAPGFQYQWSLKVNQNPAGWTLLAGYVDRRVGPGANVPNPGKYYRLCKNVDLSDCNTKLTGTMSSGLTRVVVPLSLIGASPGSAINVLVPANCPGLCSNFDANGATSVAGDSAAPKGYVIPGGVQIAVAPASTPNESLNFVNAATVDAATGAWSGSLTSTLVRGAQYKAAARTCYGLADQPTCVVATQVFTA